MSCLLGCCCDSCLEITGPEVSTKEQASSIKASEFLTILSSFKCLETSNWTRESAKMKNSGPKGVKMDIAKQTPM